MTSKSHAEACQTPTAARGPDLAVLDHATRLIQRVCCLAGETDLINEIRIDNVAIRAAIEQHDTATLFDWLMAMVSYQGLIKWLPTIWSSTAAQSGAKLSAR
jgi:hypothetical protein